MASTSQTSGGSDIALSTIDAFIPTINLAKDTCGIIPAQIALGSASTLLTMIKDSVANAQDFLELGRSCADVCETLGRGLEGRELDDLSGPLMEAIGELTATTASIQNEILTKRTAVSKAFHSKVDKGMITGWEGELKKILQIFNTELFDVHQMVLDLQSNQSDSSQDQSTQCSVSLGEIPPPPPGSFFGREELIEKVVKLAENLKPIALIGAGGIGKTSIARAVLHHNRIKEVFGDDRRFVRCDQFPASRAQLLTRLSEVVGAGIENPEDLASLRPFLSSRKIFIILDNAESTFDPKGTDAQEINAIVNELCQIETVCLLITSRISTVPRCCARPEIPTLSMDAACDIFYDIYGDHNGRTDIIEDLLRRLDFHALSITLLATTGSHNDWSHDRLAEEWKTCRARVLRTDYDESLATSIDLSLNSPTFLELGPHARDLLGVVAFFPKGVDEKNLDWFFPTISDRMNIFDKFCVLSLTYRSDDSVTMLAPIRDYLSPQDPKSSPLLCSTKDQYFTRLSHFLVPNEPGFAESQWIGSENVNVEYLLDTFTSIDPDSEDVWDACNYFLDHLYWHKPRETILTRKVEGLPDDHPSKPWCLFTLAEVFGRLGNITKRKDLLSHTLTLRRQRGSDPEVAITLRRLSDANRLLGHYEEGIGQVVEASEIFRQLGDTTQQLECSVIFAYLLLGDEQLDAAEDVVSHSIALIPENDTGYFTCRLHRILGGIYHSKGEEDKAIHHLKIALGAASSSGWRHELFWAHYTLAKLFRDANEFDQANAHIDQAVLYTTDDTFLLGRVTQVRAEVWYRQGRVGDAISEAQRAVEIFEQLGAADDAEHCRLNLQCFSE